MNPCVPFVSVSSVVMLLWTGVSSAQTHPPHEIPSIPPDLLTRPVTLRTGIGKAHDTVATTSADAQAFYDQGLAYVHGYVWIEAARSFNQALRLDENLAMAHVGLTFAYTELNKPDLAREAMRRAQALAPQASAHDRRHIEARALQMAAEAAPADGAKLAAYRKALDAALIKDPGDAELWMWRGIAESPDPADRGQGSTPSSVSYYIKALSLGAVGVRHYLTHAYENANQIDRAIEHAAAYARAAPTIPHALHMHGHVLRRSGRIDDAIAAFEAADRAESEYFKAENIPPDYDWHYEHNLDLLASSYQYVGRMTDAAALLKKAFDLPSTLLVQMYNKRSWPEFLIARGRADEAIVAAKTLIAHPVTLVRAVGHIEAGHAMLAAGRFQDAATESNLALREMRAASDGQALVAPALEQLQGEFFLRTGQREQGHAALQELARKARALPGPDNWVQALFTLESIARAAREVGDWEFARWAADQMLAHDPNYAGSHYALGLVAEHAGDRASAAEQFTIADQHWRHADSSLPEIAHVKASRADRTKP